MRSDLVALAPEITGRIIAVHVVDNQTVKKGDKLVTIDPVPFQLVVNQTKAQIEQAKALLKSSQEELGTAQAALAALRRSANVYAAQEQARYADLAKNEYAPRANSIGPTTSCAVPRREMTISQIAISKAQTGIVAHQAAPGSRHRRECDSPVETGPHAGLRAGQRHDYQPDLAAR